MHQKRLITQANKKKIFFGAQDLTTDFKCVRGAESKTDFSFSPSALVF